MVAKTPAVMRDVMLVSQDSMRRTMPRLMELQKEFRQELRQQQPRPQAR